MIRSVIASWTLFFGLLMISAGSGLQNVLLGTRAPEIGFSNIATGFVMSGYFVGIFLVRLLCHPFWQPLAMSAFLAPCQQSRQPRF